MTVTGALEMAVRAAQSAHEKGATDVLVVDVSELLGICDYFVVATASNPLLVKAVVDKVEESILENFGVKPRSTEGVGDRHWVLLDYGDIVVHIFLGEDREYYRIERLYSDAPKVDWEA